MRRGKHISSIYYICPIAKVLICLVRLPLVLARGVTFGQFARRTEKIKARRFMDYRNGTVTIIELPTGEHEVTHAEFSHLFLSAFNNAISDNDVYNWGSKSKKLCQAFI